MIALGFEASIFVLVFGAMFSAHLAGIATWRLLSDIETRLRGGGE